MVFATSKFYHFYIIAKNIAKVKCKTVRLLKTSPTYVPNGTQPNGAETSPTYVPNGTQPNDTETSPTYVTNGIQPNGTVTRSTPAYVPNGIQPNGTEIRSGNFVRLLLQIETI